jgi:hypothetical protein
MSAVSSDCKLRRAKRRFSDCFLCVFSSLIGENLLSCLIEFTLGAIYQRIATARERAMREVNGVLWASLILIVWGLGQSIYDVYTGHSFFHVPDGGTLLLLGILFATLGQALYRVQAIVLLLERRAATKDVSS